MESTLVLHVLDALGIMDSISSNLRFLRSETISQSVNKDSSRFLKVGRLTLPEFF